MRENMREVPGTNGMYLICTDGWRCWSRKKNGFLSDNPGNGRYIIWRMSVDGIPEAHQSAWWIAMTFPELVQNEWFPGAEIDHIDTDRLNNDPSNLRWVDRYGQMNNPITKKHISDSNKGEKCAWWGRKHTEEEKRKISETLKKRSLG